MDKVDISKAINQLAKSSESTKPLAEGRRVDNKTYQIAGELLTAPEILWKRLSGLFGYPFTRQYGTEPTPEWIMAIDGIEPQAIGTGLRRMVESGKYVEFPPNPLAFRLLCLPTSEELGLPPKGEAYYQAINWSRIEPEDKFPAVLQALQTIPDVYQFRRMNEKKAEKMFNEAWGKVVEHVAFGGELPEIPLEVEQTHVKASGDVAKAAISKLKDLF